MQDTLPFSEVSCFSGSLSVAACNTTGSPRPFALNAYTPIKYLPPGFKPATANL